MSRRAARATLALAAMIGAASACDRRVIPQAAAPAMATPAARESPELHAPRKSDGFLGLVIAPETVDVTSQLEARVKQIDVRAGDHVTRGAVVAKLDTRSARHELAIAAAELAAATTERDRGRLDLAHAEDRLRRRETSVELPTRTVGTVSDEEVATARYEDKVAAVKVAAAEANVASRAARLAELRTLVAEGAARAPFDGTVVTRYLDVGSLVHKGAAIVRIIEAGDLRVRFAVPEESADSIAVGDPVHIETGGVTLGGVVEKVSPEIDAATRMVFAEASLDAAPPKRRIRSGQVARVYGAGVVEQAAATTKESDVGRPQ